MGRVGRELRFTTPLLKKNIDKILCLIGGSNKCLGKLIVVELTAVGSGNSRGKTLDREWEGKKSIFFLMFFNTLYHPA